MGILDGIVEWIAEQVMHGLDLINTSVLGALGCDMSVFLRYFPAAETMYDIFVALAIGLILLIWIWNLFKNFGIGGGGEAEDPVKLSIRSVLFILLAWYAEDIVHMALDIGGTPYSWILTSALPNLSFADFNSVLLGVMVFTAPVAFAMGASQATSNIFKSWCRMFAGQIFLLLMNAWCLKLFTSMVGAFIANPLSL